MRTIVKQYNSSIRIVKSAEKAGIIPGSTLNQHYRCASFLLRMRSQGRPIHMHLPHTKEKRIAVGKAVADILANGAVINQYRTENVFMLKRVPLHFTADIVEEMYRIFYDDIAEHGSFKTLQAYSTNFCAAFANSRFM